MPELSKKDFHDVRLMDIDSYEIFSNALNVSSG